jgi:phage terminase large subunit-like protein
MSGTQKRVKTSTKGPWEARAWMRKSKWAWYADFLQKYCRLTTGATSGQTFKLMRWQKDLLEEMFADGIGLAGVSIPKGQGKSTFAAGLCVAALFRPSDQGAPYVPIVSGTVGQGERAVFTAAELMVELEPELADRSLRWQMPKRITIPRTHALLHQVAASPSGLQGGNVYPLGIADEWGELSMETFEALAQSRKRPGALIVGLGTPGFSELSPIQQMRKRWRARELTRGDGFVFVEFGGLPGTDIFDRKNWARAMPSLKRGMPPLEVLELNAKGGTSEASFRVFHLGEFDVRNIDAWLSGMEWDESEDEYEFDRDAQTFFGIDVARTGDSTAICGAQSHPDGGWHAKLMRLWLPTPGHHTDQRDVMAECRSLHVLYPSATFGYDDTYFGESAAYLADDGLKMISIAQSKQNLTSMIFNLDQLIRTAQLSHDKDDAFREQVLAAAPRRYPDGSWSLKKGGDGSGKIDAVYALAFAVDGALHPPRKREPVYVGMIGLGQGGPG